MSADCKGLAGHVHSSSNSSESSASSNTGPSGTKDKVTSALKKARRDSKKPQKTSSVS